MRPLGVIFFAAFALTGACTLIADVDREKIPAPQPPPFPEVDGGSTPDAGDGGSEPPPADDGGTTDAADAAPEPPVDAAADATSDAEAGI